MLVMFVDFIMFNKGTRQRAKPPGAAMPPGEAE